MSPLRFELAGAQDDAELRHVLAATPMAGKVAVSFRREPSFFDAAVVEGEFHQTIVAREDSLGHIVGHAGRSVRQRFINGAAVPVGYLGGLRVLPKYRGGLVLAGGYRFLHSLHNDERTQIYLTTIAERNDAALAILTSGRAGLPRYEFCGNYHTAVIPIRRSRAWSGVPAGVAIRSANAEDLPQLCDFVNRAGRDRQFFPCYRGTDWFNDAATFRGLRPSDLYLAFRGGEIVGSFGCWDQSRFRQMVVEAYDPALTWSVRLYNALAVIRRLPKLPTPGEALPFLTAALPLVADDDAEVFIALLETVLARSVGQGRSHLLLGMHERDPLIDVVRQFQAEAYTTRCYLVYWEDGVTLRQQIDPRPLYLELGCL